ncbi:MAG: adenosylcobalamin-dependent ribonucleoside-diphosphate reductase [Candidatus Pacearchaeota archaeon]
MQEREEYGKDHERGMSFIGGSDKYPIFSSYEPPFSKLEKEQVKSLEERLKTNYEIKDYHETMEGLPGSKDLPGYEIKDKRTGEVYRFSPNARLILETRYLEKDERKRPLENILDLLTRVAVNIAEADLKYDPNADVLGTASEFLNLMLRHEFLPNTPTLCNAGRKLQQLSACFVLPIDDYVATDDIGEDVEKQGNGIYDVARNMAMIHKSGGGTGFNFSRLRPKMDSICTTFGSSSGPISFIKSLDSITDAINQGGFRRGANMGILEYWHPDILEFIYEKTNGTLQNFNLSVGVDSAFMEKVKSKEYFNLINPKNQRTVPLEKRLYKAYSLLRQRTFGDNLTENQKKEKKEYERQLAEFKPSLLLSENGKDVLNAYTGEVIGKVNENDEVMLRADLLFEEIAKCAWATGCPGVIFLDKINATNPTPHVSRIESTNPCGEQPLLPYEACNLGSVNLHSCVKDGVFDYNKLERIVRTGVHFLDNVIDMSKFPFKKIHIMVKGNRKIGLGVMGFADMLYNLRIPYDSQEAVELGEKIMKFITETARDESLRLSAQRGEFPNWKGSVYDPESEFCDESKKGLKYRNALVTTIAPTGTISMICDVSSGIEPVFSLFYNKVCMDGRILNYRNQEFRKAVEKRGLDFEAIIEKAIETKNLEIDEDLKRVFKSAHEISPDWHIKMQAAFQKYTDNAVSKTINMPNSASVEQVKEIYMKAWQMGCKGITIYRDMSKPKQVLYHETKADTGKKTKIRARKGDKQEKQEKEADLVDRIKDDTWAMLNMIDSTTIEAKFLDGTTYELITGCGKLFVTVNHSRDGRILEVFQNMSPPGGCGNAQNASTGVLASLYLQQGGDIRKIYRILDGTTCPRQSGFGNEKVSSCTDAMIKAMRIHQERLKLGHFGKLSPPQNPENIQEQNAYVTEERAMEATEEEIQNNQNGVGEQNSRCPECGAPKAFAEGCERCTICDWTRCS